MTPEAKDRTGPRSFKRQLQHIKDNTRIEKVAADFGEPRLVGSDRLVMRCVSPTHPDRRPSLVVYPDRQTFKCFGCGEYGDVLDLVRLAERCELWESMMIISTRYGVELPGRPESWSRKQQRQQPVRDHVAQARYEHLCRRLFRKFFQPALAPIQDVAEHDAEARELWKATEVLAEMLIERGMRKGGRA
jgi:DNA primase